jgi:hypothetical protein
MSNDRASAGRYLGLRGLCHEECAGQMNLYTRSQCEHIPGLHGYRVSLSLHVEKHWTFVKSPGAK